MRKRDTKLNVYLNFDEKRMLDKKAKKTGLSISTLIRMLITNFEPKEKPDYEFYEYMNSMRKIGNILNQIARRMHILGYVEDEKFLKRISEELYNLIIEIKRKYLLPDKVKK